MAKKILHLIASLEGKAGNTYKLIGDLKNSLPAGFEIKEIELLSLSKLTSADYKTKILEIFTDIDALVISTGTYWDSWSSHLQRFLEESTFLEASPLVFSKPASIIVSMHTVGGKEMLSRLQGVLSTQGYLIPPQSSLVLSYLAEKNLNDNDSFADDFWTKKEIPLIMKNLCAFIDIKTTATPWEVDQKDPKRVWA